MRNTHPTLYEKKMNLLYIKSMKKQRLLQCILFSLLLFTAILIRAQEPTKPPLGCDPCKKGDLVELVKLDSTIKLDIRYATENNFAGMAVYPEARAFLQRPAAEALLTAHHWLKKQGYGLIIYDAYRPWSVTKLFWDITPQDKRAFVANPAVGSVHNRGCAVDVGLYKLTSGLAADMPGDYDEMTERSFITYTGGTAEQRAHRDLLRKAMEREGSFTVYRKEWWHYDFKDYKDYPILNIPFSSISQTKEQNQIK